MSKFAFRIAVAVLVVTMMALLSVIGKQSPEFQAQQAKKEALTKPLSAEWIADFTRRVMDACDRLPVGDPNRPSEVICNAPRAAKPIEQNTEQEELLRVKQAAETVWRAMKAQCAANQELVANALHSAVIKLENDATRATVSLAIWKHLNEEQRQILGRAVRCHQTKPSVIRVIDVNGVEIGTM